MLHREQSVVSVVVWTKKIEKLTWVVKPKRYWIKSEIFFTVSVLDNYECRNLQLFSVFFCFQNRSPEFHFWKFLDTLDFAKYPLILCNVLEQQGKGCWKWENSMTENCCRIKNIMVRSARAEQKQHTNRFFFILHSFFFTKNLFFLHNF